MTKTSPSDIDVHIGRKLKLRRIKLGKSLQDTGDILDVSFQQIQKYEKGLNKISSSNLFLLSQFLNTNVNHFFEGFQRDRNATVFELHEDSEGWDLPDKYMSDKELLSLIKAYYQIEDAAVRKKVLDLIQAL